ncbi:MAG: hypothetical protein HKO53_06905, partial [Gemmatimonadetes bacterium]|nr:hypothetical protein [Gemmatimonadota bacterium]
MSRALLLGVVCLSLAQPAAALTSPSRAAVPDSIQDQLRAGRYWKASVGLRAHLDPLALAGLQDRLVLAQAEAGWKNWAGVVEVLEFGAPQDQEEPGEYWYLLGVAREQLGDRAAGREALERYLAHEVPGDPVALVARSRLLRNPDLADGQVGALPDVLRGLQELRIGSPVLADWTALELAAELSRTGRPEETAQVLDLVVGAASGRTSWSWVADAWAVQGDTAEALRVLEAVDRDGPASPSQATFLGKVLPLRLAVGDSAAAARTARELLALTTRGASATQAARFLIENEHPLDGDGHARAALALGRGGED